MKENWKYKKLGEVCQTTSGGTPSKEHKEYYENGIIPWLRSGEVANRNITKTELYITNEGVNNSSAKIVPTNSVVIAMYGATVGQVGILRINTTTNQAVCSILPCDEFVPEFVYYFLKSKKEEYVKNAVGGAQPNISQQIIKNTDIPVPPLPVQQQIVAELDLLSDIIEKQKQQIAELDKLAQATFYDMFGDPVTNEKGWEKSELGKICDVRDGTHDSPEYYEHGFPLVTSKNIIDGCISFDNVNYICEEDYLKISKRSHVDNGDIIMPMIGTIGKPVIVKKNRDFAIKNVALIKFIKDSKANNIFIQAIMSSRAFDDYMKGKNKGGTQKFIALGDIRKLDIPVPPLSLQQSFASKIEAIERQKELISNSIKESRKLFDSRMEHWFG